jgi:hypothetical protein
MYVTFEDQRNHKFLGSEEPQVLLDRDAAYGGQQQREDERSKEAKSLIK